MAGLIGFLDLVLVALVIFYHAKRPVHKLASVAALGVAVAGLVLL